MTSRRGPCAATSRCASRVCRPSCDGSCKLGADPGAWNSSRGSGYERGVVDAELRLTPLRTRTQARDDLPQQAADYEAQQGVESFARWAGKTLAPALLATELRSWDDVHRTCGRFGVVLRAHGNGLVFEDAERGVRVKASSIGRDFSKPRLSTRFGDFQPASARHLEASGRAPRRYSPMPRTVPRKLWMEYTQSLDRVRLQRTETWDGYREIRPRLANEPKRHTTTT
jgi:hypothetical protein